MSNERIRLEDRFTVHKSKFFYLLSSLIIYFISTSLLSSTDSGYLLSVFFTLIILFSFYIIAHGTYLVITTLFLGLVSVICHWMLLILNPPPIIYFICYASNILFLSVITFSVLHSVTQHKIITADTLFGAISGYFLIGFTWAFIYILTATFIPGTFNVNIQGHSIHESVQHFLYYSFTTMTTLGLGDILPVSNFVRTCSWLEAIAGQTYLAVWISQLVGLQLMQKHQK